MTLIAIEVHTLKVEQTLSRYRGSGQLILLFVPTS